MPTQIGQLGVTFPDSTLQTTAAIPGAPGFGIPNIAVISVNGFWVVPSGVTRIRVTVIGGGGGAGEAFNGGEGYTLSSGGGGGGGTAVKVITGLTPGASINVTIGSGGVSGGPPTGNGGTGGTSSFGTYCSATGGLGSPYSLNSTSGGSGGIGINGTINSRGGVGIASGGGGGSTLLTGTGGNQYGAGAYGSVPAGPANTGYAGVVIVEY